MTAAPPVVSQPSLFGLGQPTFDRSFAELTRHQLSRGAWVDHQPAWLSGHEALFEALLASVEWESHRRPMYERMVDVPRLTASLPEPAAGDLAIIDEMAGALGERYGAEFSRVGIALYRDGRDSVAWHGDQVAREMLLAVVATVSLGEPRPFCLRPKGGGEARRFRLGHGDLVVMGGTCQRTWEHAVPKVARAGPRMAVMFRPVWPSRRRSAAASKEAS